MKIKKEKLKVFLYPAAFVMIAALSLAYKLLMNGNSESFISTVKGESQVTVSEPSTVFSGETNGTYETEETSGSDTVQVYICGAVTAPGVYEFPQGVILNDVVICAGGFTETADATKVNLVYEINTNVSVFIPDICQTDEQVSEEVFSEQDDIIRDEEDCIWGEGYQGQSKEDVLININTASKDELMTLPGIGEVYAQSIIDYREQTPFASIEEIMNVSGIGDSKFEKIKPYITV